MPTYQQRFGHAPHPQIVTPPKKRSSVVQSLTPAPRSRALATKEGGIGTQPKHPAPMTALERQQFAHRQYLVEQELTRSKVAGAHPNAVGKFLGGIGQHPLTSLRDVTGIDVHRFYHPEATIQKDRARAAKLGREYEAGKISGAQAARSNIGMFPGGGKLPGIGKLFGRAAEAAVPDVAPKLGPLTRQQSEQAAGNIMRKTVLPAGRRAAAEQRKLIRVEKTERVAKAMQAEQAAGGGVAGLEAAKGHLAGEYSKVAFDKLHKGISNKADVESLSRVIDKHTFSRDPQANFWARLNAKSAIQNMHEQGAAPRDFENDLLREVFSPETVRGNVSKLKQVGHVAMDLLQIPRSVMSTLDVSFGGRQGLGALAAYPRIFGPNWARQFKLLVSEGKYQEAVQSIHDHPNYKLWKQNGLALQELPGNVKSAAQREEYYPSSLAERANIPLGGGRSFGPGKVIRASGRAFSGQSELTRLGVANHIMEKAQKAGVNVEDRNFLRATARLTNVLTGRGGLGKKLEPAGPALNTVLFAPRLMSSRIAMLNPGWYISLYRQNPYVGREAVKAGIRLAALSGGTLYGLHKLVGASVGSDPTSADFLKAKFGNTRVDVMAGFQQYMRLAAQLKEGKVTSTTTGKTMPLGGGIGHKTGLDILIHFAEGKANPTASFAMDFFRGTTYQGQPLTWKTEVLSRITPLVAQDTWDLYHNTNSAPLASLGYVVSALGVGMQTYGPKKKTHRGSSGSGARPNSLLGRSSGGSGGSLLRRGSSNSHSLLRGP